METIHPNTPVFVTELLSKFSDGMHYRIPKIFELTEGTPLWCVHIPKGWKEEKGHSLHTYSFLVTLLKDPIMETRKADDTEVAFRDHHDYHDHDLLSNFVTDLRSEGLPMTFYVLKIPTE